MELDKIQSIMVDDPRSLVNFIIGLKIYLNSKGSLLIDQNAFGLL